MSLKQLVEEWESHNGRNLGTQIGRSREDLNEKLDGEKEFTFGEGERLAHALGISLEGLAKLMQPTTKQTSGDTRAIRKPNSSAEYLKAQRKSLGRSTRDAAHAIGVSAATR